MKKTKIYSKYFVLPGLVLYIVFFVVPSFIGIYFSFTDWNRYSSEVKFVGLENYRAIFASGSNYLSYVRNTLNFTIISNIVKIIPALFLALLLSSNIRGQNVHRAILFFPALLPYLVIGLIFRSMLHPQTGFVNNMLRTLGLDFMAKRWLIDPKWVWPSIYAVDAWRGIGYVMTIFIAGLSSIPRHYYEVADIDGANFFQKLIHITLPMLKPAITINLIFGITYGLKVFDIIFVLTNGGPGRMTEVINTAIFKEFALGTYGMGTALSTLLFVFMVVVSVLLLKIMSKRELEL
ncbi:MAG TPA: sugar ABC transporter permease [Candidatus Atribacteria bacterium]|nr:sugar ABC transporter permease [Candidatus Atribacteria bacterium]